METIKASTKKGMGYLNAYEMSEKYSLTDCVCRPSPMKRAAEKECREIMEKEGGEGFKIIYYTGYNFACAWKTPAGLRVELHYRSILVS